MSLSHKIMRLKLPPCFSKSVVDKYLSGKLVDGKFYDVLVSGNCDVVTPDGKVLGMLRKRVLDPCCIERARPPLEALRKNKTTNRGSYSGKGKGHAVSSSIIGYWDRFYQNPFCRQTAFTAKDTEGWRDVLPYIRDVDKRYSLTAPFVHSRQLGFVSDIHEDFRIEDTGFTTVTVNNTVRAACHYDKGDYKGGMGVLTALRNGDWHGSELIFPRYRVAFSVDEGDLLLFNPHEMHGNGPMIGEGSRTSCIFYARTKMTECGSAQEELARAKELGRD